MSRNQIFNKKGCSCGSTPYCKAIFSLSTETELLDDCSVSLDVSLLEVIKKTTPLTYELEECKTSCVVFLVALQMLGKVSDTVGK